MFCFSCELDIFKCSLKKKKGSVAGRGGGWVEMGDGDPVSFITQVFGRCIEQPPCIVTKRTTFWCQFVSHSVQPSTLVREWILMKKPHPLLPAGTCCRTCGPPSSICGTMGLFYKSVLQLVSRICFIKYHFNSTFI